MRCLFWAAVLTCRVHGAVYYTNHDLSNPASISDQRTDVCNVATALHEGRVELPDALNGLHLHFAAVFPSPESDAWFEYDSETKKTKGFHASLIDEVASQAGFTYDLTVNPESDLDAIGDSWSTYLDVISTRYDVHFGAWFQTIERGSRGQWLPYSFLDVSLVAVKYGSVREKSFYERFWAFADPFEWDLWVTFVLVSVATAFIYLAIEHRHNLEDFDPEASLANKAANTVYRTLGQFTGAGGLAPHTWAGKFLLLSYSLLILLVTAAYTANVRQPSPYTYLRRRSAENPAPPRHDSSRRSWWRKIRWRCVPPLRIALLAARATGCVSKVGPRRTSTSPVPTLSSRPTTNW